MQMLNTILSAVMSQAQELYQTTDSMAQTATQAASVVEEQL